MCGRLEGGDNWSRWRVVVSKVEGCEVAVEWEGRMRRSGLLIREVVEESDDY